MPLGSKKDSEDNKKAFNNGAEPEAASGKKSSWLSYFSNQAKKEQGAAGDNFRKDKEAIKDYQTAVKKEKAKRASQAPQYTVAARDEPIGGPKEEGENSREAVLNKFVSSGKKWQAPKLVTTNLIKGEVTTFVSWRKNIIILAVSVIFSIAVISAIYVGLMFWEKQANAAVAQLEEEILLTEKRISQVEKDTKEVDIFQEKLALVDSLIENHIYWTNIFKFLENSLLSETYITSDFSSDLSGSFSFPIEGKSYADITNLVNLLRSKEEVLEASVKAGSMAPAGGGEAGNKVTFIVEFKLDPAIFTN